MKSIQIHILFTVLFIFSPLLVVHASSEKGEKGETTTTTHAEHPPHDHHHDDHIKKLDEGIQRRRKDEKKSH